VKRHAGGPHQRQGLTGTERNAELKIHFPEAAFVLCPGIAEARATTKPSGRNGSVAALKAELTLSRLRLRRLRLVGHDSHACAHGGSRTAARISARSHL
jgi:hypothetical protein